MPVREAAVPETVVTRSEHPPGLFNLAVAYVLLVLVGGFELGRVADAAVSATGFGARVGRYRAVAR